MPRKLDLSRPRPLRSETEYDAAVREIDALLDRKPAPRSPAARRLELLSVLVEAWDRARYPMGRRSTPRSVVLFMLEQKGKSRADLIPLLGSKSRVSEFLNGKRRLSLAQISALRERFAIPADLLIDGGAEYTYPPPAVRAAAVREQPSETKSSAGYLAVLIPQFIRAQKEHFERLDARLTAHENALREIVADLRKSALGRSRDP